MYLSFYTVGTHSPKHSIKENKSCCSSNIYFWRYGVTYQHHFFASVCYFALAVPPQLLGIYTMNMSTELIFVKNNGGGGVDSLIQSVAYPIRGNVHTAEETETL